MHNNSHGQQPRLTEGVNPCALCSPSLPEHKEKHFHYTGWTKCLGLIEYISSECIFSVLSLCQSG